MIESLKTHYDRNQGEMRVLKAILRTPRMYSELRKAHFRMNKATDLRDLLEYNKTKGIEVDVAENNITPETDQEDSTPKDDL